MPAYASSAQRGEVDGSEVVCGHCGHADKVTSAIFAPTPTIVRAVCRRDPCPACGRMTMRPAGEQAS